MSGPERNGLEDQEVERSLWKFQPVLRHSAPFGFYRRVARLLSKCKWRGSGARKLATEATVGSEGAFEVTRRRAWVTESRGDPADAAPAIRPGSRAQLHVGP